MGQSFSRWAARRPIPANHAFMQNSSMNQKMLIKEEAPIKEGPNRTLIHRMRSLQLPLYTAPPPPSQTNFVSTPDMETIESIRKNTCSSDDFIALLKSPAYDSLSYGLRQRWDETVYSTMKRHYSMK
jgi:hypothetical protein